MENLTKMDDLGVPLFLETSISSWVLPSFSGTIRVANARHVTRFPWEFHPQETSGELGLQFLLHTPLGIAELLGLEGLMEVMESHGIRMCQKM